MILQGEISGRIQSWAQALGVHQPTHFAAGPDLDRPEPPNRGTSSFESPIYAK